jgi:hypothetical protein
MIFAAFNSFSYPCYQEGRVGKTDKMPSSFRTTMFKRDYEKRQHQIKSKNQKTDDKPVLTVNM